jgi:hypothetical protein
MALTWGLALIMALRRSGWESMASTMGESKDGGGGGADDGKEKGGVEVEVEARGEGETGGTLEECGVV